MGFCATPDAVHGTAVGVFEGGMVLVIGAVVGAAVAFVQFRSIQYYEIFACVALGAGAAFRLGSVCCFFQH